jgi:hypothetical protein
MNKNKLTSKIYYVELSQVFSVLRTDSDSMKKLNLYSSLKKDKQRFFRWIALLMVALIIVFLFISIGLIALQIVSNLEVSKRINDDGIKLDLRNRFDRSYNYTELFLWEHQHLNFTWDKIERHTDPIEILNYGKGRCGEFAILYAALCLAHGYECRFDTNIFGDHQWVEIKVDGEWIHFDPSLDPSDPRINDRYTYERDWKSSLILVLAFENSSFYDVTNLYRSGFWINIISAEMFSLLSILMFILLFIITSSSARRFFYGLYFKRKKGLLCSIGKLYERKLRYLYVLRFVFLFLLPIAIAIAFRAFGFPINIQDNLLNLIAIGFAMMTFSAIEMPSLTKPHVFISVLSEYGKEITSLAECKEVEMQLTVKVDVQRVIMFRAANLCMHTLKDCTFIFNFPKGFFSLLPFDDPAYKDLDFKKEFTIQKRNDACLFTPKNNFTTMSPSDCLIFPVIVKPLKESEEKFEITVEVSSQSTWGSSQYRFPIKFLRN